MATRGRKPKPTAMKELEGNPGFGSLVFSGCLPGLPSSSFMAVGFGFLPLVAIGFPSLL